MAGKSPGLDWTGWAKCEGFPPTPMTHIGIEIGGTKIQIVAGGADGTFLERHRLAADRARGGAGIREQIAAVVPGLMARHPIASVGVGFGGPVDPKTGQICCSHQVPG